MLNNLETLGKQTRVDVGGGGGGGFFGFGEGVSLWLPYMKIRDFTFTSLSDAV
jgi:hypothetical protein